jgi:hypothetical protein
MSARWLVSLVVLAACGSTPQMAATDPCTADDAACACSPAVDRPVYEGANHVPQGTMVNYRANPPTSGSHWPFWSTTYGSFPDGLPREEWMHNLEHGGVVLLYNCPAGCDDEVQRMEAIRNGRHPDEWNEVRILIVPDALMPHKFAAVAWNYRWQGDVLDDDAVSCFIDARYDRGPESTP